MDFRNLPLVSSISLVLASALILAFLSASVRAQEGPAMVLSEDMRQPLRDVSVTFASKDQSEVVHLIRLSASKLKFASRMSDDPSNHGDFFLQLYRTDLKMICEIRTNKQQLNITVYRNIGLPEPSSEIDFVVKALRNSVAVIPSISWKETIFIDGDNLAKFPGKGIASQMGGEIVFPKNALFQLTDALSEFAEKHQMAVRFQQISPDPQTFSVSMYSEVLMILGSSSITTKELQISIYKTGDRSASDTTIAATLAALKEAVEMVPGVTFMIQD